jgi:type VI secretion system protein ImpL
MVLIALGFTLRWWDQLSRWTGAWLVWVLFLILIVGIIVVLVGSALLLRHVIPRYRERRFLTRLRAQEARPPEDEEAASYRQLQEKMQEAIRTLERSPDLKKKGELPLYAVPWYLLIGASQAGKTTLLRSVANFFAPFVRPPTNADTPTQNCDWWFFNTAIILDTAGRYALHPQGERDRSQWYRFLQLLRASRELQPINGVIIAVAADTLVSKSQEELRLEAAEMRKRIDEANEELGVDFPVYLLITRCDTIEGFTEFFNCFPEQTLRQVLGYVHETPMEQQGGRTASTLQFAPIAETLVERLKQLRLSLFNVEKLPAATLRQRIFCFPEEFSALQQPLTIFVETLLVDNPFRHSPWFRGLFFSSAQQQGARYSFLRQQLHFDGQSRSIERGTRAYFLHDLFDVILRRDQYLVRPTSRAIRSRLFKHLFGFSGCVAFCVLLLFLLTQAFWSDRRIRTTVQQEPCAAAEGGQGVALLLEQAESCRQVVQALIDRNRQRSTWGKLVFNRSGRLEDRLRQRYVEKFASEALAALDTDINQRLSAGTDSIPLVFLLITRIELLTRCLSLFGCPQTIDQDLQPDYQLMLASGRQQTLAAEHVTRVQETYETYLRWASTPGDVLRREQETHAERLRGWFSAKQFAPRQILLWVNQRYPAVTLQTYWEGVSAAEDRRAVQVEGAYTPKAWQQSILPFLQRAADAVPDMAPLLKEFQAEYRTQYFAQWRRFLADFPRGESLSRESRRRLAVKFLDEQSPYQRILDATVEHLKPFLPVVLTPEGAPTGTAESPPAQQPVRFFKKAQQMVRQWWNNKGKKVEQPATALVIDEPALPAWVRVLRRYLPSDSRKAYLETMKQIREPLADDAPLEKSFQFVRAAFQEEQSTEKSSHPMLKLRWIINQFRDQVGTGVEAEDEQVLWPLLERPVLFVWKVMLDGAGGFLQKSWADNVVAPIRGRSGMEQVEILYGTQDKVRAFVDQFMKPFLVDNESRFDQVLGEEIPISPTTFQQVLRDEKQFKAILAGGKHLVTVGVVRKSEIDSPTNLEEEKTELSFDCEGKEFKISNQPQDGGVPGATIPWAPQSCGEVVITVFLSCEQACVKQAANIGRVVPEEPSLRITKRYAGQDGFLNFIRDFQVSGRRDFAVSDFVNAKEVLQPYEVKDIKVFFRVDVPPGLKKLMSLSSTPLVPSTIAR